MNKEYTEMLIPQELVVHVLFLMMENGYRYDFKLIDKRDKNDKQ